jgi:hypothetical protein
MTIINLAMYKVLMKVRELDNLKVHDVKGNDDA